MTVQVSNLGLAAYMKMHGAVLLDMAGKEFVFESDKSVVEWKIDYSNSCCSRHDSFVCELRTFLSR